MQKKKRNMYGNKCINGIDGRNPFTIYVYQIIMVYTLNNFQFYLLTVSQKELEI